MPKRTMTITRIWIHEFRKPAKVLALPTLPGDRDLLDAFEAHANASRTSSLIAQRTETYAVVTGVERDGRCLTVTFRSGRFGEDGEITDVRTGANKGQYTKDDATTVVTHGVFIVPRLGDAALAFTERSAGFGGMSHLLETFNEKIDGTYPDLRMKRESVVRSDAWFEQAQLMRVTGTVRKYRSDVASDGRDEVLGTLRHVIVPEGKAKYFPRRVFEALANRKISRAKFLGFSDGEPDEIDVTVGDGDQEKTYVIDNEKTPNLRLVLSKSGDAPLSVAEVKKRALSEAPEIFKAYDVDWAQVE